MTALTMRARRVAAAMAVLASVLAGCTAVPSTSSPEVVESIDANGPDQRIVSPAPGLSPRSVVLDFLDQNASTDANHNNARAFLTAEQRNRWPDSTVTVVDRTQVSNPVHGRITVTGQAIGTVDSTGAYTPSLRGDGSGSGGLLVSDTFVMKRIAGQWRIDSLPKGLLLTSGQFEQYQQRVLYFYDAAENHLVPVPRYTQLTDPSELAAWLMTGLAAGPPQSSQLQTGLPGQTDAKRLQVQFPAASSDSDVPVKIEIPGAAQLDSSSRDRLATQVAATMQQSISMSMEITDGGAAVRVPAVGGPSFTATDLASQYETFPPPGKLYYVRDGGVFADSGQRLSGKVGAGAYNLISVALRPRVTAPGYAVAGVRISGKQDVLDVGTQDQLITVDKVHGRLSRPAWTPGEDEVWVGEGSDLWRVTSAGSAHQVAYDAVGGKPSGDVTAVRVSPEGDRLAMVLDTGGSSRVYVGTIVRGASQVQIPDLTPITPQGVKVTDIAWNDALKLLAVGKDLDTNLFGVYEVQCDGSLWTPRGTLGLPGAPDSVTVTENSLAAVSIGPTLWRQKAGSPQGGTWEALGGDDSSGTNPVYIE